LFNKIADQGTEPLPDVLQDKNRVQNPVQ